jgi:3-methylcrotonyl-CoA carboxylase alpha subunit
VTALRTLLIANRGEIAVRIARTARRMGIETVAVYSDADANAMHVRAADRAVRIGPAPARESYLDIGRIIAVARATGADAVHPGYGFLSENANFVDACMAAGLIFVGPPASAMRRMGSKAAAKALMEQAGVPVLPGYHGDDQDAAALAAQASRIGFPLVIKAVAGGGGRGMRVVHAADEFAEALASARQEGASAFGDDRVLLERYVTRPRHIEVQVFADTHGNAVHLFERDCSAQRRHQKVIEEAPAPGISPAMRASLGEAAVQAARSVGYVGAGTAEFVAEEERFYFLEMNTRLQVEHPVTEAITGFDLVEWQLRVAAGETLPATQDAITMHGHAVEARLYAEDPTRDYAPSVGRITTLRLPADRARIDTGFAAGDTVTTHYDAMLAKIICHAPTRHEALAALHRALLMAEVAPLPTNLDLLARIVAHPAFVMGGIDTGFIGREAATLLAPAPVPDTATLAIAALGVLADRAAADEQLVSHAPDPGSPWHVRDGWWLNMPGERPILFEADGIHTVFVSANGVRGWNVAIGATRHAGRAMRDADGGLSVWLDGVRETVGFASVPGGVMLRRNSTTWRLGLPEATEGDDDEMEDGGRLIAPLPGQVTAVHTVPGRAVARGDVLVVMEAMKTVFRLTAPADGVVATVGCTVGETVEDGQVLVTFAEA